MTTSQPPLDEHLHILHDIMATHVPFNRFLGVQVVELTRGKAVLALPFRPEFVGDPIRPALHGGVISMLADTCGGAAVWTQVEKGDRVSTIDLRVDYLLPGPLEQIEAAAHVLRVGNRVGVANVRVYARCAPDRIIAEGKGVYSIRRASERDAGP